MVGLHLLLSPASTVVKSALPEFAHRPNPIQEGNLDTLSRIKSRCHARPVTNNLHKFILFCQISELITCRRMVIGQGTEGHISWIVAMVNLVLVEGRIALSVKTNVFVTATLHCDLSDAHVMHMRDADKTSYGTVLVLQGFQHRHVTHGLCCSASVATPTRQPPAQSPVSVNTPTLPPKIDSVLSCAL